MNTLAQHSGGEPGTDAPSVRGFIALLEAFRETGGTAPAEVISRLLIERNAGSTANLTELNRTGQVFGFEWRDSLWIPMFQFDMDDLALKAGPQRVRAVLPAIWSGWAVASWFAAPNARLDRRSPADMLDTDLDIVLGAARSLEGGGESSYSRAQRAHVVVAHI